MAGDADGPSSPGEEGERALLAVEIAASHRMLVALDNRVGATAALGNTLAAVGLGLFGLWLYGLAQLLLAEPATRSGALLGVEVLVLLAAVALIVLFVGLRYREVSARLGIVAMDLRDELLLARAAANDSVP